MEKPLLELTSHDSSFSVTVGRSSPAFIFGTRDLPDGQGGFESFIFDPQALTTEPRTGKVTVSDDYDYSYGGEDGRDLLSRSEPIPIGRTGFVRTDLTLTKEQEEGSDELVYTREFAISENFRRTTGDTDFSSSLGPESLGSITPGRDIANGDRVHLRVWDKKLPVIVSGMTNGVHGWAVSVNSIARPGAQEITGHWTKKAPPAPKGSTGNHFDDGGGYSSGSYGGYDMDPYGFVPEDDYIPVADTYDNVHQDIETLSGERLLENVSKTDGGLLKTFRDGTEEEIELELGGGGGGTIPDPFVLEPGQAISQPEHNSGHSIAVNGKFHGADRLQYELHTHLTDLSPKHSYSQWHHQGGFNVRDIGPLEPVTSQSPGLFVWNLTDDAEYDSPDDLPERPFQDPGLWAGTVFITVNMTGDKRLSETAILSITWDGNERRVELVSQGGDYVLADSTINISSIGDRNLTIDLGLGDDPEGYPTGSVSALFLPDYGEMLKASATKSYAGTQFGTTTIDIPRYREDAGTGLDIESFVLIGAVGGKLKK